MYKKIGHTLDESQIVKSNKVCIEGLVYAVGIVSVDLKVPRHFFATFICFLAISCQHVSCAYPFVNNCIQEINLKQRSCLMTLVL